VKFRSFADEVLIVGNASLEKNEEKKNILICEKHEIVFVQHSNKHFYEVTCKKRCNEKNWRQGNIFSEQY